MTNARTMRAVGLAAATLVVFVVTIAVGGALHNAKNRQPQRGDMKSVLAGLAAGIEHRSGEFALAVNRALWKPRPKECEAAGQRKRRSFLNEWKEPEPLAP